MSTPNTANIPEDLKYTKDHQWVRLEDGKAVVGITDFAQHQLGDVVYIEIPEVGKTVKAGGQLSVVESVKAVSDIYAPLSGVVVEVNSRLSDQPELINQDPYGEAWIAVIAYSAPEEIANLLDAAEYKAVAVEEGH